MQSHGRRATLPIAIESSRLQTESATMSILSRLRRTRSQTNLKRADNLYPMTPLPRDHTEETKTNFSTAGCQSSSSSRRHLEPVTYDAEPMRKSLSAASVISSDPAGWFSQASQREAEVERSRRLKLDRAQKAHSDAIDKAIKQEAGQRKRMMRAQQTVLLLGQSGAGKTTILKQMRTLYAPEIFEQTRSAWVPIIHLNMINAVKILLQCLERLQDGPAPQSATAKCRPPPVVANNLVLEAIAAAPSLRRRSLRNLAGGRRSSTPTIWQLDEERKCSSRAKTTIKGRGENNNTFVAYMRTQLAPLFGFEVTLRRRIGVFEPDATVMAHDECGVPQRPVGTPRTASCNALEQKIPGLVHVKASWQASIRTGTQACHEREREPNERIAKYLQSYDNHLDEKAAVKRSQSYKAPSERSGRRQRPRAMTTLDGQGDRDRTLSICDLAGEVIELWRFAQREHLGIQQRVYEEGAVTFFLDNVHRIARQSYVPTDDDILHARVRTVGASEECFKVARNSYLRVIDVGGCRTQRLAWAQFFDQATAIIFMAPLSNFNEALQEDARINAVLDSLLLWKRIVASPLLRRVSMILFLNKMDILQEKLEAGIGLQTYFPHYNGDSSPRCECASRLCICTTELSEIVASAAVRRYFQDLFRQAFERHERDARGRQLYIQATTATSTSEIRGILKACREVILRHSLRDMGLV